MLLKFVGLQDAFYNTNYVYEGESFYATEVMVYALVSGCCNLLYEAGIDMIILQNCFIAPIIMACGKIYMTYVLNNAPEHLYIENSFYIELTS